MDPSRKRKIRLVVALSAAVLLAVALIYTSFSAATDAKEPSQIMAAGSGTYEMTGEVVRGSIQHNGSEGISFFVTDRKGSSAKLPVSYKGAVPDPFRGGREIVLTGSLRGATFVGQPETLITKCPSKFTTHSNG